MALAQWTHPEWFAAIAPTDYQTRTAYWELVRDHGNAANLLI